MHNVLLRTINAIYLQCENVSRTGSDKDAADFVNYCQTWAQFVGEHHRAEEEEFFPAIEKMAGAPGVMGNNVEQHHAFHGGLEAFGEYLAAVQGGKEKFDGSKLKGIIDGFMPVLREHLSDEIDTLIGLEKFDDKVDWAKWMKEFQAAVLKKVSSDPKFKVCYRPTTLVSC